MYDDILLFINLFNNRKYSILARKLSISQSTISRRIEALERQIGHKLVEENTRYITLTEKGKILYEKFKNLQNEVKELIEPLYDTQNKITGRLKVMLPVFLSHYAITPYLPNFMINNPELQLSITYNSYNLNMTKEKYDIALLAFQPQQQTQRARLVHTDKIILVCSQQCIDKYGKPCNPENLAKYPVIGKILFDQSIINYVELYSETSNSSKKIPNPEYLRINSFLEIMYLVKNGTAIAGLPEASIQEELSSGELIRILPDYHCGYIKHYLVRNIDSDDLRYTKFEKFILECLNKLSYNLQIRDGTQMFL